ncbi:hypothetical protein [Georgenia thermotolerans]|uniref:hypothetical protein n=1 Tax=Georgenia thermotolerans TaxID=527326 RepID=UPI0012656F1B|nr:hypothetical protein [Georgenia thermotolerans]
MNVSEWIDRVIHGPGGMDDYGRYEIVAFNDERVDAVTWAIRCLANPNNKGAAEVLDAIQHQRATAISQSEAAA